MGSALGLAARTPRARPFHAAPWRTLTASSLSSSLLNVTKANVCLPRSFIL
uniref:Uncharacterized protein n=1 Tax=Pavo cristatus TaxID=9049 RepID=A0A8C9FFZ8_PAVCR